MKEKLFEWAASSTFYKKLHGWLVIAWTIMFPVALLTDLKTSLPFVVFISLYANWASEFASWQASRAEIKVDEATVNADNVEVDIRNS